MTGHNANALRAGGSLVTRERLELHGAGALADQELLAILVGANGARTAGALLEACGTVQQLAHETAVDLARIKGMTPARAAMVVAGVELGRRTLTRPRPDRTRLSAPRDVAAFLPTPSVDDVALTERLEQVGALMGIEVLDHVILADTRYCSFKEMGRL